MLWRSGEQIIAQRDEAFVVIEHGAVSQRLEPRSSSDEDDLWRWAYLVVDDRLVERTTIQHAWDEERVHEERTVVGGLRTVDDDETRRIVKAALTIDAASRSELERADERRADARVATIIGAVDDLRLGVDAARAQRVLIERIRRWDDRRAAALLRTLIELARAHPDAAVIAAYVRGCLFACYSLESPEPSAAVPITPMPALARAIEAHANEIEVDADGQEQADAPRNAAALWNAAKALRHAAALLS